MKLIITRTNLDTCLGKVAGAIPSRTSLPVLSNVLFEATDTGLRITSTDLDSWIRTEVPADVHETGRTTLPGATLRAVVKNLPPRDVQIKVADDRLSLSCGNSNFELNGIPADDYPALPEIDFDECWAVPSTVLLELIERTAFSVSTEESRPLLNGVLWELRDGSMKMVATDGHRLATFGAKTELSGTSGDDLIVPPPALRNVQKLFAGADTVEVTRTENYLAFRNAPTEIYTRLIEGKYPNYEQVIPKDNQHVARVATDELAGAIARIAPITSAQTHRMRLRFEAGAAYTQASSSDVGEARDVIDIDYDDEPMEIGFNATYLKDALDHMPSDRVLITFKTSETAVILKPDNEDGDATLDFLCLVMPLRLLD